MAYVLTEEGRNYMEHGLPERRLIELVKNHSGLGMGEARGKMGREFSIALQWCKKYGCIEVKDGSLFLRKEHPKDLGAQENAMKSVFSSGTTDDEMLTVLVNRKLAEKEGEKMAERAEKLVGKEITNLTTDLIKTGTWQKVRLKPYNVEFAGKTIHVGKRQPYNKFLDDVRHKLVEMGFREMSGPTIELEFWNFDALFQPQNHPSRDWTQTYSLKQPKEGSLPDKALVDKVRAAHENGWRTGSTGWGYKWDPKKAARLMPRAHGTAMSARMLTHCEIPGKYFAISRCYRPDIIDATHGVEFNQTEGIVIDESLNFRNLLGVLKEFAVEFAGAEKVKFLPDYYPFTEPSVQMSAKHPELGWVELGGAGIFREELTKPLGVDVPVIAWGLGVDRLAMFKLGIKDIRNLFSQNLDWLRKQVVF
ncbi:MAG TPA: phenylalanine--tRNA ligase subunit alpha [archaeon]|nr:phenylalanine--tRNA ligase subunit alpha [archaeon]